MNYSNIALWLLFGPILMGVIVAIAWHFAMPHEPSQFAYIIETMQNR